MIRFLFFYLISTSTYSAQLEDFCKKKEGKIVGKYQCPKSKITLKVKTCEFKNKYDQVQFINGCSGPSSKHNHLFFNACVTHDLCYHHEPATTGRSQKECDESFLKTTIENCYYNSDDFIRCQRWANIMYFGLRLFGKPAYHCANDLAYYEY